MKLCNLVDIVDNNMECVILKVKDGKRLDLIKLGYFTGDEDIIRLTKGERHICSVFNKDGTNFSWEWGKGEYTLVDDGTRKKGWLIQECITEDFDIYIGGNIDNIIKSLFIRSLDDIKDAHHFVELMYFTENDNNICVHKDRDFYKHFTSIFDAKDHFYKLGYNLYKNGEYIAETGCIVEQYRASKTKEMDYEI